MNSSDNTAIGLRIRTLRKRKGYNQQELADINSRKTGALLTAACRMGVAAGGGNEAQLEAASLYGAAIGAAFQIRDDMLDVLGNEQELGKPIGSDAEEKKNTYMALYGAERCARMVEKLTAQAKDVLRGTFEDTAFLCALADSMAVRTN